MNSANREFQEKRNFIRMKIDTPADVELLDGKAITEVTRVVAQPGAESSPCLLGLEIKQVLA